jgi:hypothetical protein
MRELVTAGELGDVTAVDVGMRVFGGVFSRDDIRFNYALAGGAMVRPTIRSHRGRHTQRHGQTRTQTHMHKHTGTNTPTHTRSLSHINMVDAAAVDCADGCWLLHSQPASLCHRNGAD